MTDQELLALVEEAKTLFGACRKHAGAVTAEAIRKGLSAAGIPISQRDVFIVGLPHEIDLLVLRPGATGALHLDLVYRPEDVLAVIEVKNAGSFGQSTIADVNRVFTAVRGLRPELARLYVTLEERRNFNWAVTEDNVPGRCYTLFEGVGSGRNRHLESTGTWSSLLADLATLLGSRNAIERRIFAMTREDAMDVCDLIPSVDDRDERVRLGTLWARRALDVGARTGPDGPYLPAGVS